MSEETEIDRQRPRSVSTWFFVLGALVGMIVSVDTSWRFFADRVGVTNVVERVAMFAGIEILLVGCGWAMFEGVRGLARRRVEQPQLRRADPADDRPAGRPAHVAALGDAPALLLAPG